MKAKTISKIAVDENQNIIFIWVNKCKRKSNETKVRKRKNFYLKN